MSIRRYLIHVGPGTRADVVLRLAALGQVTDRYIVPTSACSPLRGPIGD